MNNPNWRKFKKVELHRHMEGSVRLKTVLEVAEAAGVPLPTRDLEELKHHALITEKMSDLGSVLNKFFLVQSVLATPEIIKRVAYENCLDAFNDGIRVLELRYSPGFISINHPKLTFDQIHQAVVEGVTLAEKDLQGRLAVGLVGIISREQIKKEAEMTCDFVCAHASDFVGFDLAGNEVTYAPGMFKKYFDRIHDKGLGITVHAGEVPGSAGGVRDAIRELGAQRIGHGVQIINDPDVMDYVREHKVVLELCPTSNVLTNAVKDIKSHPIRKLMDYGVRVTLNSDDPHIFGIDLTHEYDVLSGQLGFTEADFTRLNEEALKATFIKKEKALKAYQS